MRMTWNLLPCIALACALLPGPARAGATLRIDENRSLSVALATRLSVGATEGALPNGQLRSYDAGIDAAVLAITGVFDPRLRVYVNAGRPPSGELRVIDAFAVVEPLRELRVWAGRFLSATDRSGLSGPFFSTTWDAPFVAAYPSLPAGRDDGLALWGEAWSGRLKYQTGAFRGRVGGSNPAGNPLFTGRVTLELLDAEPGYYLAGSYLGSRDVLAFGAGARFQRSGLGTADQRGDVFAWNADLLAEKRFGPATLTLEAALYRNQPPGVTDAAFLPGWGYYVSGSALPSLHLGPGRAQLTVRFQSFAPEDAGPARSRVDGALAYLLDEAALCRFSLSFGREALPSGSSNTALRLAVQLLI